MLPAVSNTPALASATAGLLQQDVANDPKIRELFEVQIKLQNLGVAEDLAVPKLGTYLCT